MCAPVSRRTFGKHSATPSRFWKSRSRSAKKSCTYLSVPVGIAISWGASELAYSRGWPTKVRPSRRGCASQSAFSVGSRGPSPLG
eukprot:5006339-Amphidinium_carterae.1